MISKNKLRTASDILSRLRWDASQGIDPSAVLIGYMDRIEGPMEKPVKDFISASTGGDIPEHRILYFRRSNGRQGRHVLWDRVGRVDRVFGSGQGRDAPVANDTIQRIQEAKRNMQRIEEEKEERRKQKAKLRARRSAKQKLTTSSNVNNANNAPKIARRFHWQAAKPYVFITTNNTWSPQTEDKCSLTKCRSGKDITIATWNVLFDLFDNGLDVDEEDAIIGHYGSTSRWQQLCSILQCCNADVISLQEVTPSFLKILSAQQWVRESYVCSACPEIYETVSPSGGKWFDKIGSKGIRYSIFASHIESLRT